MIENASTLALGTLGIALIAIGVPPVWNNVGRPVVVAFEETSHTVATLLTGRWIRWVKVKWHDGGETRRNRTIEQDPFLPALVVHYLAGYSGPPVAGLLLARGVDRGWNPEAVLITLFVVVAMIAVFFHGDWYTLAVYASIATVLLLLVWRGSPQAQWGTVVLLSWVLLVGGLRRCLHLVDQRGDDDSDATALRRETGIPADAWIAWFLLVATASLIVGARWLLASG